MKKKLPNWVDVYPHGTKEGDEELKFFISLARNPKFKWRSTSAIAKESGLTKERVEEIIQKYYQKGMIFQNPTNEDQYGYHGRVTDMIPNVEQSISGKDKTDRINKVTSRDAKGPPDTTCSAISHISPCVTADTTVLMYEIDPEKDLMSQWVKIGDAPDHVRRVFYIDGQKLDDFKLQKLENLKLQFLAQNPTGLMMRLKD